MNSVRTVDVTLRLGVKLYHTVVVTHCLFQPFLSKNKDVVQETSGVAPAVFKLDPSLSGIYYYARMHCSKEQSLNMKSSHKSLFMLVNLHILTVYEFL